MIVFESKKINTTFNSIPLENISTFDKNSAYISGAQRIYDNKIYEALVDIPKTVNHIWNDTDSANKFGFDLYTNARIPDPTNVYIQNVEKSHHLKTNSVLKKVQAAVQASPTFFFLIREQYESV